MINILLDTLRTWIVVGISAALILVFLVIFLVLSFKYKKVKPVKKTLSVSEDVFLSHIGGEENIISYKLVGSRLTLELKDYSKVDKEALKADNIDGIIEMSNKIVLVKEDLSEELKILESTKHF